MLINYFFRSLGILLMYFLKFLMLVLMLRKTENLWVCSTFYDFDKVIRSFQHD